MASVAKKVTLLLSVQVASCGMILIGPTLDRMPEQVLWQSFRVLNCFFGVVFVISFLVFLFALLNLGRALTPSPIPKRSGTLVVDGLYAYSRHPIYSALIFMALGWTGFWFSKFSLLGSIALIIVLRKKAIFEEQLLIKRYGKDYEQYTLSVNRFLPTLRGRILKVCLHLRSKLLNHD